MRMLSNVSFTTFEALCFHTFHLFVNIIVPIICAKWTRCYGPHRFVLGNRVFHDDNLIYWSSKRKLVVSRFRVDVDYLHVTNWMVCSAALFLNSISVLLRHMCVLS